MLYNLFDDFYRLNREFDRLIRSSEFDEYRVFPEVNIYENSDEFVAVVKVPGVKKEDINLSIKENSLKISGEKKKVEHKGAVYLDERKSGKFERNFSFNERIDPEKVSAELKDGMLMITMKKAEDSKPKAITIN